MTVAYWVLAALLGAFYLFAGGKKLAQSKEQLAPMMGWVDRTPMWLVRVIGVVEVAGVGGLILPRATVSLLSWRWWQRSGSSSCRSWPAASISPEGRKRRSASTSR